MSKRRILVMLDACMFVLFTALLSWRLTGLELHEVIGIALIALILVHLVVHWGWVETRAIHAISRSRRRIGDLVLNGTLFIAMGTTLVSGVVISKVLLPNTLAPGRYLQWHSLHESATTLTLLLIGLHLALNWDRVRGALRTGAARSAAAWRIADAQRTLRHITGVSLAIGVLVLGLFAYTSLTHGQEKVLMRFRDGHEELRAPPPEITRAQPGANEPRPAQALPRLVVSLVLLAGTAAAGRRFATRRRRLNSPLSSPTRATRSAA